jgi:hypothetical protein
MQIYQSDLAVTRHPIKKVRFEKSHFRGRPTEKAIICEVVEEKPAVFMAHGNLICHPSLYRQFRAKVDIHNSEQGTFRMPPPLPPMTVSRPIGERYSLDHWSRYGLINPLVRPGWLNTDIT